MTHDITITLDLSPYYGAMDFNIWAYALVSSGNLVIDWGDNTSETASPYEDIEHTYQSGNIYTITIDGVSDIRDGFLSQNGDVTEVILSSNITNIGNEFCIGTHVTEMIIPNSITSIGDDFCNGTDITEIVIPENVTSIGDFFCADSALNAIHIPSNVATIGSNFCYMCSNLRAVSFSTGLTEIGEDFVGKTLVSRLEFPEGLSFSQGFADAPNINTIIYPSSIDDIGMLVFENGYFDPQKIVFKSHTPPLYYDSWENFNGTIYVPEGCINNYIEYGAESGTYPEDPSYYKEILTLPRALDKFGALMRANLKKQGIETQRNDGLTTLINKVNDIQDSNDIFEFDSTNDYASNGFGMMDDSGGESYFTLKIPSTITTLGDTSFDYFTEMKICEIPSSVVSIGNNVFKRNHSLEKIIFKGTTPPSATSSSFVTNSSAMGANIPTTCVIEVPCNALSAYKSATNYPDPTVYTYQCIRFDEKCDSSPVNSNISSPILVYGNAMNGVQSIVYNSQENAYELSGSGSDAVILPINGLNGITDIELSCEVKIPYPSSDVWIGLGVTPPESGTGQTINSTSADVVYVRAENSDGRTTCIYKKTRTSTTTPFPTTVYRSNTGWIRIILNFASSNTLTARVEELDGTELATFSETVSSQVSDRHYGIYYKDNGDTSIKTYIRNIKCIGY